MARPRKPTALLAPDAFRRNPSRARPNEPRPTGPLGDPPARFTRKQKACWRELASICPPAVLGNSDRWWVEITAILMERFRAEGLTGVELSQLTQMLGKLGLSPADRSKVITNDKQKDKNPFASLDEDAEASSGTQVN